MYISKKKLWELLSTSAFYICCPKVCDTIIEIKSVQNYNSSA